MEKVIRNGQVAVLYSPGYGAGWTSWCYNTRLHETLLFHPLLVEMVENGNGNLITNEWLVEHFGKEFKDVYCGGANQLEIKWVSEHTIFKIDEYDGAESVVSINEMKLYTA
jgi:hypothetical protein